MKSKQKKELHSKTLIELKTLLNDVKKEVSSALLDKVQNKLKNLRLIFVKRKEIAQILSIIREKELLQKSKKEQKRNKQ